MQPGRAVIEDELEDGAGVMLKPFHPQCDRATARQRHFVQDQFLDRPEMAAVFVTTGTMQQQIFDGRHAHPSQLRHALGSDTPQSADGSLERLNGWGRRHRQNLWGKLQDSKSKI
jgi:hypothetical protein